MRGGFTHRHIGVGRNQIHEMLSYLGVNELEDIVSKAVPESIISKQPLSLSKTISEREVSDRLRRMRRRNRVLTSMIGMGYHDTIMPAVIKRNVLENPAWYTAYTPYQAEISQGRLEALLNFQQMITDLTGMDIANASLLDESTAAAEGMSMAKRVGGKDSRQYFVDHDCHPQTISVVQTRARHFGFETIVGDPFTDLEDKDVFGVLLQHPGSSGDVRDLRKPIEMAHQQAAIVTVAADILALVLLTPPGEMGADIVVGNSQRFGVPMGYGGPHAAYFASREKYIRSMPGRIIGVSLDNHGDKALRMALQTREQHIRRERATSNICTSQVLPAVIAGFYAIYYGPRELRLIAQRVHRLAQVMVAGLEQLGVRVVNEQYFDTVKLRVPSRARRIAAKAREARINFRVYDADYLGIALDETTTRENLLAVWEVFASAAGRRLDIDALDATVQECVPDGLLRTSSILQHPVFELYHSETEMMRYMRWLARRDMALDRTMIPLGSCTMKLNAATELEALSYRDFNAIHPFVALDQAQGYMQLFEELEDMLCDLTGFDAFSLQPNAGSQGEYTGLLVIRKYHEVQGQGQRNVCLIPASAHGTNPASAVMAGLEVVVIACDRDGNVDMSDLQAKVERHSQHLSALMITYPSTHGVYEPGFQDICSLVHNHGGQVYLDGANMNALVGIARPAEMGADVMHINLHKTFAIPHGGGGPGMGPIGVKVHLAPFLPGHPLVEGVNPAAGQKGTVGTVSAAPWGSASILTISWAYIAMMGADGLRRATLVAILNANYIAARLRGHYPVLYTGRNGMVAHECILDLRPIKQRSNITVDDIAKRLVDYGFHAPTISFPVADTLMIEPTESENKRELDRFCDAMISIRKEIERVEQGESDRENNPLKNAPHTHRLLLEPEWKMPYSKQEAFYPLHTIRDDKYWPPVGRVDNLHGDRNLFCSCPPIEDYSEA
ncbi:MAG: aminomethyl-transferring glycine dehydrogenase [Gammaproteobacteria bacterium]|nr:aminomethyl-transferring glycine dehydrogenase [Gammaproteobacteria bacterium]